MTAGLDPAGSGRIGDVPAPVDLDPAMVDLAPAVAVLERQRHEGLHLGAQLYVSLRGMPMVDVATGESAPGRALRTDDVMLWYSSGKPLTTVAILQLRERGLLALDERIAHFVPGWANGKERCTLRHVLVHTGGFPMYGERSSDEDIDTAEALRRVVEHPAEWEPGTAAGYHPTSGWRVLAAVVERVDGRPIDRYLRDEVLEPIGCHDTSLGVSLERQHALGERLVPVEWTGHRFPLVGPDGKISMRDYRVDRIHNEPWYAARVEPGGGARGPARELGRFYESLLGHGARLLDPTSVELMGAAHRHGMFDRLFAAELAWGLGTCVDFTGGAGRRAFGHGGMASSRGLVDPESGLVMVVVANGLPAPLDAERRLTEVTDAVYTALGPAVAPTRLPLQVRRRPPTLST